MKRHERFEPIEYKHEQLMDELNEFMMDIKTHLYNIPVDRHKPTISDIDQLHSKIDFVLKSDAKPCRKMF